MTLEEHKALVRGYLIEVVSQGNMSAYGRYFADDAVFNGAREVERTLHGLSAIRAAFPDFKLSIDEQIAEGDRVMTRVTFSGTHLGPLGSIAPTGRKIRYSGIALDRVANGKVVEMWHVASPARMLDQIRLVLQAPAAPQ